MKRYIVLMALLAVVMSCNTKIDPDTVGTIVVTASVNGQTKAGYDNANLPANFVIDINQGGASRFDYSWIKMTRDGSGDKYSAAQSLLWASDDRTGVTVKAMTLPFRMTAIDASYPMTVSVSEDQSVVGNLVASDLMGASTGNGVTIDGDNVKVAFNHLMSKLQVSYEFDSEFSDRQIIVKSITLNDICTSGGYDYSDMVYDSSIDPVLGNVSMYHNSEAKTAEAVFYPYVPSVNPTFVMNVIIDGAEYQFSCPIVPKTSDGFVGGKRYKLNVAIVGSSVNGTSFSISSGWDTISYEWDFITE